MRRCLYQEFYKFRHQKTPWYGIIVLLLLMLYTAVMEGTTPKTITMGFGMGQWISIVLSAVGSICFGMEYQNRTISTLFYKNLHKRNIFLSKLIVLITYDFVLIFVDILATFILKLIMVPGKYQWVTFTYIHKSLLNGLLMTIIGSLGLTLLIISIIVCLICLIKVSSVAISLGLLLVFLGQGLSGALVATFGGGLLKWNPLNMINIIGQLLNPSFFAITHLTDPQLIWGTIFYIVFFLMLGYLFFKQRRA
ncbi:MAG: ABC transporter permease [Lentilactobacillus buchneri]|nr:ABC transporter permease [Lentilactobacillus buchneri]MCI2019008.1 ABC transporter permease [Lentilactobacillus buchneri]